MTYQEFLKQFIGKTGELGAGSPFVSFDIFNGSKYNPHILESVEENFVIARNVDSGQHSSIPINLFVVRY